MLLTINAIFNEFLNNSIIKIKHNAFLKINNNNIFWSDKAKRALSDKRKNKFLTLKKKINHYLNKSNDNVF